MSIKVNGSVEAETEFPCRILLEECKDHMSFVSARMWMPWRVGDGYIQLRKTKNELALFYFRYDKADEDLDLLLSNEWKESELVWELCVPKKEAVNGTETK